VSVSGDFETAFPAFNSSMNTLMLVFNSARTLQLRGSCVAAGDSLSHFICFILNQMILPNCQKQLIILCYWIASRLQLSNNPTDHSSEPFWSSQFFVTPNLAFF
jgi:hypothetical protein